MNQTTPRIVLASASPRRVVLLREMGLVPIVRPSSVDETTIPADHPRTFAIRAAYAKANDVAAHAEAGDVIIAADSVVTRKLMILGKPRDREDARRIIKFLSGETHHVITGIAVIRAGAAETHLDSETTEVQFRPITDREIESYLDSANYMDKAGAYGIQEHGGDLVEKISGDYYNVMGLPCRLLAAMLGELVPELEMRVPEAPQHWLSRQ